MSKKKKSKLPVAKEILLYSYWEHFKAAKELALIFPPSHPKMLLLQETIADIQRQISENQ